MTTRKLVNTLTITIYAIFILLSSVVFPTKSSYAKTAQVAPEYLVIAGYLYKFFLFFEWPENSPKTDKSDDDTICIGILGDDPFENYFTPIEGQRIKSKNKKIIIRRFGSYRNNLNLNECEILFISRSEKSNLKRIINGLVGEAVLTVGYIKDFTDKGGMINLVDVGGLLRWEINLFPIENAGIKVSSNIVQSAFRVIKTAPD